ncbi:MAG TPA: hypothetical protein VFW68_11190 [Rhodocyclaceae bacterium]|nr:hypothetical protein [Rhodocyclaceae bacterium]
MNRLISSLAALSLALGAATAFASDPPVRTGGEVLTGIDGMTLYTFDNDPLGKSSCNGPCVSVWHPLAADATAVSKGEFDVIVRDDDSKQWAYKGKPLYFWAPEKRAGEKGGDGYRNLWHAAKP